jgi:hypothetical protein
MHKAKTFRVISISDESLDHDAMPAGVITEYTEQRENWDIIAPYIPTGASPTIYVIKENGTKA